MPLLSNYEAPQSPKSGLLLLQALILGMFFIFAIRFWYLQVHRGEKFADQARENQVRQRSLDARRGTLRDRNGVLLAVNQPAYALALVREDCKDVDKTLAQVSQWTGIELDQLKKVYEKNLRQVKPFDRKIIAQNIPHELLPVIEANEFFWPGLEIVVRPRRMYRQGPLLAHILGYVAEASEEEIEKDPYLSLQDLVGKQGLEYVLEKRLRGTKGLNEFEVDVHGRSLNNRILRQPVGGENLSLSIDLGLQEYATKQMEGLAGSVVVLDPATGQILALVTQPSYDNNNFTTGLTQPQWAALQDHPRHPLQNRAIQSVYPPGSIWKLVVAACALHEGIITPKTLFSCAGSYTLGNKEFRCWLKEGHGTLNLKQALIHSCDVYFYQLGEKLGVDRISRFALASGFGKPTGVDLPHEKGGVVPTREWKRRRFGEAWHGGENLNLAIGQGYTLVQPLQVARFLGALLNGGKILKPNLLLNEPVTVQGDLPMSKEQRDLILDAMVETVEIGTAKGVKRADARIGGKTGTAQVIKIDQVRKATMEMPYAYRDHAWLASWGEKDHKTYVVVVMIEHGGHGGAEASPVAKAVYKYLFRNKH